MGTIDDDISEWIRGNKEKIRRQLTEGKIEDHQVRKLLICSDVERDVSMNSTFEDNNISIEPLNDEEIYELIQQVDWDESGQNWADGWASAFGF